MPIRTCEYLKFDNSVCDSPCEGTTDYCGTHNRQLRKEAQEHFKSLEKRKQQLNKPKKIYKAPAKVSEKRKVLNAEYSILRDQFLKNHDKCELKLLGCTIMSNEVHHTASGTNKVKNLNNVSTWKAACTTCHMELHDKMAARLARELGLKI
jgi:hypothetical protein